MSGKAKVRSVKILFLVTEDWYFYSHRLPLAVAAQRSGYDVAVATRVASHLELIEKAGIRVIPLKRLKRSSLNPLQEIAALLELLSLYRRERPDLVHQVALKPVLYGSIAARLAGVSGCVNALGGLGFVFSSSRFLARVIRPFLVSMFRFVFNDTRSRLILQNRDDLSVVTQRAGVELRNVRLVRSAGVDIERFAASDLDSGLPIVMLASRMLWDKGIREFVEAADLLRQQGVAAKFVLVGEPDGENPSSVPHEQLREWQRAGDVEWWGYCADMPATLAKARVVCLPSFYGEGIPKVLIEAMACARPIITTDTPGCRELVVQDSNGLLVPPRDATKLALAIKTLLTDRSICEVMGRKGRSLAEQHYASPRIISETMSIYKELIPQ